MVFTTLDNLESAIEAWNRRALTNPPVDIKLISKAQDLALDSGNEELQDAVDALCASLEDWVFDAHFWKEEAEEKGYKDDI